MSTPDEPVLDDAYNHGYSTIHGDGASTAGPTRTCSYSSQSTATTITAGPPLPPTPEP